MLNDEEFFLLYDLNWFNNFDLLYDLYFDFVFDDLDDEECLFKFCFYKSDLFVIVEVMGIFEMLECY